MEALKTANTLRLPEMTVLTKIQPKLPYWVATATCIRVTLRENGKLELAAPHRIEDLVN